MTEIPAGPGRAVGIDIGGTGIKGAPVDTDTGQLLADRIRILTPQPATPEAVAEVVAEVATHFDWKGPIGATFPAVVKDGVVQTAANVDKSWIGTDAGEAVQRSDRRAGHRAQRRRRRRHGRDGVRRRQGTRRRR